MECNCLGRGFGTAPQLVDNRKIQIETKISRKTLEESQFVCMFTLKLNPAGSGMPCVSVSHSPRLFLCSLCVSSHEIKMLQRINRHDKSSSFEWNVSTRIRWTATQFSAALINESVSALQQAVASKIWTHEICPQEETLTQICQNKHH